MFIVDNVNQYEVEKSISSVININNSTDIKEL
jgi:hypothetical protein